MPAPLWPHARGYPGRVPLRLDLAEPRVDLAPLVAALAEGACAVIPTDTVYGLICAAGQPEACARLSALKGRDPRAALDRHVRGGEGAEELLAPLEAGVAGRARALLARGATVLVPNPSGRYLHLCGDDPQRIGLRVSAFPPALGAALAAPGRSSPRSANLHGGADPRTLGEVPAALAAAVRRARRRRARGGRPLLDRARPDRSPTRHPARGGARHGGRARAHRLMPPRREPT